MSSTTSPKMVRIHDISLFTHDIFWDYTIIHIWLVLSYLMLQNASGSIMYGLKRPFLNVIPTIASQNDLPLFMNDKCVVLQAPTGRHMTSCCVSTVCTSRQCVAPAQCLGLPSGTQWVATNGLYMCVSVSLNLGLLDFCMTCGLMFFLHELVCFHGCWYEPDTQGGGVHHREILVNVCS